MSAAPRILCLGGAAVDRKYRGRAAIRPATSNPVDSVQGFGGVARNVAENLARLGCRVALGSLVGDDGRGEALRRHLAALGIDTAGIGRSSSHSTAEYAAVLEPDGSLVLGLADMAIFDALTPDWLAGLQPQLDAAGVVFADCNLPAATLDALRHRRQAGAGWRLAVDAVSTPKVARLPQDLAGIDLLLLNLDEARTLCGDAGAAPETATQALRSRGCGAVVVTLGQQGCRLADGTGSRHLPAAPARQVTDVTGAGDALAAGLLAGLAAGRDLAAALRQGLQAAALTVESGDSVRADLAAALSALSDP